MITINMTGPYTQKYKEENSVKETTCCVCMMTTSIQVSVDGNCCTTVFDSLNGDTGVLSKRTRKYFDEVKSKFNAK